MIKKLLNIVLASILMIGAIPAIQASNGAANADARSAFRSMVTPFSLGLMALGYIFYRSNYWQRVNDKPSFTRWDKLKKAQQQDIASGYDKLNSFVRNCRTKVREFFNLFTFDAGEGNQPDEFDVREHTKKEQERKDAELARQLTEQDRAGARNNAPRPAAQSPVPVRRR